MNLYRRALLALLLAAALLAGCDVSNTPSTQPTAASTPSTATAEPSSETSGTSYPGPESYPAPGDETSEPPSAAPTAAP
jgi:nitrous oxide reductase accessory protein NosL